MTDHRAMPGGVHRGITSIMTACVLVAACVQPPVRSAPSNGPAPVDGRRPAVMVTPTGAIPHDDVELTRRLEALIAGFPGDVGVYARSLRTGATAAIRADETFPTASMIKVPLLVTLADRIAAGELAWDQPLVFADSLRRTDGDVIAQIRAGDSVTVEKLAWHMVVMSDNTASVWLQQRMGGGLAANRWLEANGFQVTRVNSKTPGREEAYRQFGWGQTTPREMAELMVMIREGRAVSLAASNRMYRMLSGSFWMDEGLSAIPMHVQVASKQGEVDRSRSEVMLVNARNGDYVLCIITKNQTDTSYAADNPGYVLIRKVSDAVYRHFNPAG
jgi:beta-lactamase class A